MPESELPIELAELVVAALDLADEVRALHRRVDDLYQSIVELGITVSKAQAPSQVRQEISQAIPSSDEEVL